MSFISLSMTVNQANYIVRAMAKKERQYKEAAKSVSDMRTQRVII